MLMLAHICKTYEEAYNKAKTTLESGKAFNTFLNVIKAQGGDIDYLEQTKNFLKKQIYTN